MPLRSLDALATVADIPEALRIYESARLGVGRAFVAQARKLGSYLRYHFDTPEQQRMAAYYADPVRVLAETAVLDFLRPHEPTNETGGEDRAGRGGRHAGRRSRSPGSR